MKQVVASVQDLECVNRKKIMDWEQNIKMMMVTNT